MFTRSTKQGFTLIELLLVIGIIAILMAIVIVAVNPQKQLGDAHNAQRRNDVTAILNAVYQYAIDHAGSLPDIPSVATEICATGEECGNDYVNLSVLTGAYLSRIPSDPSASTGASRYTIMQGNDRRVTVAAPFAEQNAVISVTR